MWKKVLAALSIPVWLFFLIWMLSAVWFTVVNEPARVIENLWVFYLFMGTCIAAIAWLLFFWGRLIWRVLFSREKPVKLEWPE